jgi:hypothetical protein
MGDVAASAARDQRHSDALDPDRRIATAGGRNGVG